MEFRVQSTNLGQLLFQDVLLRLLDILLEPPDIFRLDVVHGQTDRIALQEAPDLKDFLDVLSCELAHDEAPSLQAADKALLFEFEKGFPNRSRTETDLRQEATDRDPLSRRQLARQDGFFNGEIDLVSQNRFGKGLEFE